MFYYLYQITNKVNGKIYVGVHKTRNLDDGYMGSGRIIRSAIQKHGLSNFSKVILETFENAEAMYAREKEVVNEEFLLREDTYNLRRGGFGGWDHQNNNSEIQRIKCIKGNEKMKKLKETDEDWFNKKIEKQSNSLKELYKTGKMISPGWSPKALLKAQSDEAKEKRKQTKIKNEVGMGSKNSMFGRTWIKNKTLKQSKPVLNEELLEYMNIGWEIGRCFNWDRIEKLEQIEKEKELGIFKSAKQRHFEFMMNGINSSVVDVTIKGWPKEMAKELGVSRNHIKGFIKENIPELWSKCFIEVWKIRN